MASESTAHPTAEPSAPRKNFLELEIEKDLASGRFGGRVVTRFPPEPNGYLHVGHAKAICIDFGMAQKYGGKCNLRFDDTNPVKEDTEYVEAIEEDIRWLGFEWDALYYASDYFEAIYGMAEQLVRKGLAYVDDQTQEEVRVNRGTPPAPGVNSPFRDRSVAENLDLLRRMRAGEFPDGTRILRAKIDMAHPNLNMRDPAMYRIMHAHHHRTGDAWCIYPMYDFAHGQSDALEDITHSLCSLEFEHHRPLYEWFTANIDGIAKPRQIEFARLQLSYTLTSKRRLLALVQDGHVSGWDDPRMPTLRGMRRRGYPPAAIRDMCELVGVTKHNSVHDFHVLENAVREHLNRSAARRMAVLDPLKLVITNLAPDAALECHAVNNPEDEASGTRVMHLTREVWIERDDFMEDAPKKFFRLTKGGEVRLRYGYVVRCDEVVKDNQGTIVELRGTYDPETGAGKAPADGRKVKGIVHWVSARDTFEADVRLYDHLFRDPEPWNVPTGKEFTDLLNPTSLELRKACKLEAALRDARPGETFQFERLGYFCVDTQDARPGAPIFNRTVPLRDTWAKIEQKI
jgi:glutaminyl-tRNA synthetase